MEPAELVGLIESEWRLWVQALGHVPVDAYDRPGFDGWSLKDLVGHVTTWEDDTVRAALEWLQGRDHTPQNADPNWDLDTWNAEQVSAKRGQPLTSLLVELGATHSRLVSVLTLMPPEAWKPERVEKVNADTWAHYREHREAVDGWLGKQG